jgi:hypothetical protein
LVLRRKSAVGWGHGFSPSLLATVALGLLVSASLPLFCTNPIKSHPDRADLQADHDLAQLVFQTDGLSIVPPA